MFVSNTCTSFLHLFSVTTHPAGSGWCCSLSQLLYVSLKAAYTLNKSPLHHRATMHREIWLWPDPDFHQCVWSGGTDWMFTLEYMVLIEGETRTPKETHTDARRPPHRKPLPTWELKAGPSRLWGDSSISSSLSWLFGFDLFFFFECLGFHPFKSAH